MELENGHEVQKIEEILYKLLWSHLQSLGLFREKHVVLIGLREQAGISASYDHWLQESVVLLENQHYLLCDGHSTCTIVDPTLIDSVPLWQYWDQHKEHWMQNADLKAQVVLVETTLRALPAILIGKRSATEILFPNGSMQLVEGIYQNNTIADYFNDVLAQLLATYLQERLIHQRNARIRILEIGAGTGGTTSRVLQMLQPYRSSIEEYCYSDVSNAFLRYGERTYGLTEHPYLTYQFLNVEKPLAEQGIKLGSYDVVIASNVLHATSDIRRTVRNTKAALKKHGLLFLNEITGTSIFTHLTFGLLSGWWAYEDPELRVPGSPALTADNWQAVLSSEGFGAISFPTRDIQEVGQQIIVAESNGVVRQALKSSPTGGILRQEYLETVTRASSKEVISQTHKDWSYTNTRTSQSGVLVSMGAVPLESITYPDHEVRLDTLRKILMYMVSDFLKIRVEEIDAEAEFSEYGFDSITFMAFASLLNQTYQLDLTPALFFEHSTLERLTQHLHATYASVLVPYFAAISPVGTSGDTVGAGANAREERDGIVGAGLAPLSGVGILGARLSSCPDGRDRSARTGVFRGMSGVVGEQTPVPTRNLPLRGLAPALSSPHFSSQQEAYASVGQRRVDGSAGASPAPAIPIAIIGMSGMFPRARDVQSLWQNLLAGRDCISTIPPSRWDWQAYFGNPATEANKTNVKWAGVGEGVELFDPLFFGISKAEAEEMDPQQRLLMMYVWKAIEDAGYSAESLSGTNTALFIGTASSGYRERLSQAGVTIEGPSYASHVSSVGPNRMSYFLNLHGPSEPIETACSSSLVAIHRGVNALESGQCAMAIVGGINTLVSPETHISFSKVGMLCEDGRCKTFSAAANGYVRSEGVGMLVLKKLSDAEQEGDHIYGVIRGSAENHGGRASSFTAPNPRAQADLLIAAYRKAGIDPRTVGYIEAHGTGTALGDPIEIEGLKTAFSESQQTGTRHSPYEGGPMPQAWCGIGSVKSNIGHLELAAGVAGVIKVLLQLQYKKLVKNLHCEQINPYIQLEASPFYIVQENRKWEALQDSMGNTLPRRAGVSSFGAGGVNAHVVLEEYVPKSQASYLASQTQQPPIGVGLAPDSALQALDRWLVVLSAKNEERLYEQVRQLYTWVQTETSTEEPLGQTQKLQELAYTLQVGRTAMEERLALQVSSFAELEEKLHKFLQEPGEGRDWYRGQVKRHKETIALFSDDEDMQEAIVKWFQRGKYEKLLRGWVKGLNIDWKLLYTVGVGSAQDTEQGLVGAWTGTVGTGLTTPLSGVGILGKETDPRRDRGFARQSNPFPREKPLSVLANQTPSPKYLPLRATAPALPRRISLPTYPFAQERYWVETAETGLRVSERTIPCDRPNPTGGLPGPSMLNGQKPAFGDNLAQQSPTSYARPEDHEKSLAPLNELEQRIAHIWQNLLGVETVGPADSFIDLGGHSLLASRLLTQIRQEFHVELSLSALFEAANVSELAQTIEQVRQEGNSSLSIKRMTINLWDEVKLDPAIALTGVSPASTIPPRTILLTGATGFLGAFLLYELLQQTSTNIYCLLRSPGQGLVGSGKRVSPVPTVPDSTLAFQKLQTHLSEFGLWDESKRSRIYPFIGDLALPRLGLSRQDFHKLAEQIDVIYHAGAWVNFTYPYSILKTANVLGTQEILKLASLVTLKPVHFISTAAVFTSPEYNPTHVILEDDPLNHCEGLHTGYAESKWVAEKLVIEARRRGIPVSIYRPATVTGHSQTGVFNKSDFVLRMLKSGIEFKQAPDLHFPMYITPVDYVSKAIVLLSQQTSQELEGKAFNLIPPQPTDVQTLWDIARSFGYPIQTISYADWHASLENIAQDSQETNLAPLLPLIQQERMTPLPLLDSSNTLIGLKNTSLSFPPIDSELFRVYFDFFWRSGFLSPPTMDGSSQKEKATVE